MNTLLCDATQCLYNLNRLCDAEKIQVRGEDAMGGRFTYCGTFESRKLGNYVSEFGNMNIIGAVRQAVTKNQVMHPMVACDAVNCFYNEAKLCGADHIKIIGEISSTPIQTECETFYAQ